MSISIYMSLSKDSGGFSHNAGFEKMISLSETLINMSFVLSPFSETCLKFPPLQEVLNMLKESKADIFVDPVLHTACALDIKHHCAAIPPGRGRRKCSCCTCVTSQA